MLEIGKIPPDVLDSIILNRIAKGKIKRKDVVIRPKTGEDCTGINVEDEICVLSTDPITGAVEEIGYLAVQINCNDIYSAGAEPIGILLTVLLPPNSTENDLKKIMDGVEQGVEELGIEILGGHTEVSDAVVRPLVSATVVGKTKNKKFISTGGGKVGEQIVMTKWAGLEGTTIIAYDYESKLKEVGISSEVIESAKKLSKYLSVGKESLIARKLEVSAMHDATEGGILGAVWEMAQCSGLGVKIYKDKIAVKEETLEICEKCSINYLKLISSGVMIISIKDGENLVNELKKNNIDATVIGEFIDGQSVFVEDGIEKNLEEPSSDEIYNIKL